MHTDCLKLTTYFGERDRADGGFLADAFTEIYARHELQASVILRWVEGFGHKHHLRTDRLLTLSEDLPIVSEAVDSRERIEAALEEVERLEFDGLVTLEGARMLTAPAERLELQETTKLTAYVGRQERIGGRPAHGVRERARFFARNAQVPVMIIAVGDGERIAAVLPELTGMAARPLVTLERVEVCKRDGRRLGEPHEPADGDGVWQKLTVYGGVELYEQLVRALRRAGAAGATSLHGIWGYHGDHAPHGDRLLQARRHVPVVTVVVDAPQRARRWFEIVDAITDRTGLVTSELVPVARVPQLGAA